jgi:Ca2+-binding EF-hand superfamily protein
MERLGIAQTHIHLKDMIEHVDDNHDGRISFEQVQWI